MTQHTKDDIQNEDIIEEMQEEVEAIENEDGSIDEEKLDDALHPSDSDQVAKLKDALARTSADLENFKKRTERDRADMTFFLKSDILKKVLPRLDDVIRMLKNTPEDMQSGALYEGLQALEKSLKKDLADMGVEAFVSTGQEVDPEKHDVMTQAPGEEGIIIDEFETGYMLGDRVLRHAKVVVGNG
ncbi:nucleotide exchange factor GrpE [Candidatus Gracilibacteria bacterium]|nr:nucleotide exchange factor GrpE [Candidatus Gracilibacteria bacterium]